MTDLARPPSEWERLEKEKAAKLRAAGEQDRVIEKLEDQLARIDAGAIKALDRELIAHRLGLAAARRLGIKSELESICSRMTEIERIVEERRQALIEPAVAAVEGEELHATVQAIKDANELDRSRYSRRRPA